MAARLQLGADALCSGISGRLLWSHQHLFHFRWYASPNPSIFPQSEVDICRSLKPCPQAILYLGSSGVASNSSQRPCQLGKEARLRWCLASFFTGAPPAARAFVPVCAWFSVCCLNVRRTVLALSGGSGHDPDG